MEDSPGERINAPFSRTLKIIKNSTLQGTLAIISGVSVVYTAYSTFNLFLSSLVSWSLAIIPTALVSYIYNEWIQAQGEDIKNALMLDWKELSIKTHIQITVVCVGLIGITKWFASIPAIQSEEFPPLKSSPLEHTNPPLAYEQ